MIIPAPHPLLIRLAHALLLKAERSQGQRAVVLKLDGKVLPELHSSKTPDDMAHIALMLESLARTGWVTLQTRKQLSFQTLADQEPALMLQDAQALSAWSGYRPEGPKWSRELVRQLSTPGLVEVPDLPALLDYLQRNPLPWFQGIPHTECAYTLNQLAIACKSGSAAYVRQVSARHFKGHSKVLDNREELLRLLGAQGGQFLEAPVQLLVSLPPLSLRSANGHALPLVLFVENLVSFEHMAHVRQQHWADAVLVYASGFKGTAKRLRTTQGCSLYWRDSESEADRTSFVKWLYDQDRPANDGVDVCFYGDLDFAGMQILAHLRQSFSNCRAWRPGYEVLLSLMTTAHGHTPATAGKDGQLDPRMTGCIYSDEVLLPSLRSTGLCIDQEVWPVDYAGSSIPDHVMPPRG